MTVSDMGLVGDSYEKEKYIQHETEIKLKMRVENKWLTQQWEGKKMKTVEKI